MGALAAVLAVACVAAAAMAVVKARRDRRRSRALATPFAKDWIGILEQNLPPYAHLTPALKEELHQDIKLFLCEKSFEGCGGVTITDEIRVTIAAQACMLLLNRKDTGYPKLRSVLVYPSTYVAGEKGLFGPAANSSSVRLGESWQSGVVVLSWSSVKQGAFNFCDGHNVTMHEFAHQLDQENGAADGAPILERRSAYSAWARVFSREFSGLKARAKKGKRSVMDRYGATNPAEFFAVATESFYEKPRQLQKKHPELYEELRDYYKVDPVEWT